MKKIRKGVFETNSSSTHSLHISSEDKGRLMQTLDMDEEGTVHLYGGEFGWQQDTYHDANSKASYLAIYVQDWTADFERERMRTDLIDVIKKQTGCADVVFAEDLGYIDHQSVEGHALHYLWEDLEEMRQFIFNPDSYLETDNDNH